MARRSSPRKPKLRPDPPLGPEDFDPAPPVDSGTVWDCVEGDADVVVPSSVHGWRVQESRLVGMDLSGRVFGGLTMRDTHLVRCDLSGAVLDGAALERVAFTECRLTDVLITECAADLLSLRMSTATTLLIEDSNLRGADLHEFRAGGSAMLGCDLTGSLLDGARLEGTRLQRSTIAEISGSLALRGCVIGPDQQIAVGVALLDALGITVADPVG